ncbi:DUF29 domain-containing protein [Spirulina subsalsa]|uniref:DUF29 domain-containing protein n=1 Tax=Spirulina subsalsa TaxID=54311 RepID=UPI0002EC6231|nr:DUF29 domain-containing protein [Spirulina subsalsa]
MNTELAHLYDQDFNLWLEQTVSLLEKGELHHLDVKNLLEELRDMGRNTKREVLSRLKALLLHLLKWKYQPQKRTASWASTIDEQRDQLQLILRDSPSLRPYLEAFFVECYQKAIRGVVHETGLSKQTFPLVCPFTVADVLSLDYWPDGEI